MTKMKRTKPPNKQPGPIKWYDKLIFHRDVVKFFARLFTFLMDGTNSIDRDFFWEIFDDWFK